MTIEKQLKFYGYSIIKKQSNFILTGWDLLIKNINTTSLDWKKHFMGPWL